MAYPFDGLKEIDFYDEIDKKELKKELSEMIDEKYFSRIKNVNNFNELGYFIVCENGTIPKEIYFDKKMYDKLENYVSQIVVNQGLVEYQNLIEGKVDFAENVENKPALAYILNEGVLEDDEINKINFKHKKNYFNYRKYIDKYLINNFTDRVCEFFEEPGSFTLDENMIPKEFYE